MDSNQIFHRLNEHLKLVQKEYPIENIFGIFMTEAGDDEIESTAIVIPTFDNICTSVHSISTHLNKYIAIYDIREIYEATKHGHPEIIKSLYTEYLIVNPRYQSIFQKLYINNRDKFKSGIATGIPADELRIALMKVCRHCWSESSNAVRFIKQITDAEKLALDGIIKTIGEEGLFSQAKVASAVGISRLTMSNLIMKMKFNEVAIVEYMGNKGTYIRFIDDILLNIHGDTIKN